jgi:hypothetical protein
MMDDKFVVDSCKVEVHAHNDVDPRGILHIVVHLNMGMWEDVQACQHDTVEDKQNGRLVDS